VAGGDGVLVAFHHDIRLSAMRKMVGEARRAGIIGLEEAASLTDMKNICPTALKSRNSRQSMCF
jgi:hypothetical protein